MAMNHVWFQPGLSTPVVVARCGTEAMGRRALYRARWSWGGFDAPSAMVGALRGSVAIGRCTGHVAIVAVKAPWWPAPCLAAASCR